MWHDLTIGLDGLNVLPLGQHSLWASGRQSKVISKLQRDSEILSRQHSRVEKELLGDFAVAKYRFKNEADRYIFS